MAGEEESGDGGGGGGEGWTVQEGGGDCLGGEEVVSIRHISKCVDA